MHVMKVRNVEEALGSARELLLRRGEDEETRNGRAIVLDAPLTTIYERPQERVVFSLPRDANPFFHLMESVWMLAGSKDGTWLDRYVRDFSSRFAEEDGNIWGAYGNRWRNWFQQDQIHRIGHMLKDDITTRRAVMTMWSPDDDLGAKKRDIPCNTHIYFRGRRFPDGESSLDMLVSCRSNDAVWGAYGANAVHMSILHEVMAGLCEANIGSYSQMSFNFHAYLATFDKLNTTVDALRVYDDVEPYPMFETRVDLPMRTQAMVLLDECQRFVQTRDVIVRPTAYDPHGWVVNVVIPMHFMHESYRLKDEGAFRYWYDRCLAKDWRMAAENWIDRRKYAKREA